MLYAIIGEDFPNSQAKRAAARPAHLRRVDELIAAGKLILGGAFPAIDSIDPGPAGMTGSLIVAEFGSLEEAKAWINADPYVTEGVFAKLIVKPYRKVFFIAIRPPAEFPVWRFASIRCPAPALNRPHVRYHSSGHSLR